MVSIAHFRLDSWRGFFGCFIITIIIKRILSSSVIFSRGGRNRARTAAGTASTRTATASTGSSRRRFFRNSGCIILRRRARILGCLVLRGRA